MIRLAQKRRDHGGDENIVPLINIVFLLLMFFILTGTLEPAEPLEVTPPASGPEPDLEPEGQTLLVVPDGRVALGGTVLRLERLPDALRSLGPTMIKVKADAETTAETLMPVLRAIREAGFDDVVLVTSRKLD